MGSVGNALWVCVSVCLSACLSVCLIYIEAGTYHSFNLQSFISIKIMSLFLSVYHIQSIAGYSGDLPVAVKTLSSRDPSVIQKFTDETDLMKKFTHPNIVSLLGKPLLVHNILVYASIVN